MVETRLLEVEPERADGADVAACLTAWHQFRGDAALPAFADFDWFELPTEILPYLVIVDIVDGGADFIYRFWGTAHSRIFHQDFTRSSVNDLQPPEIAAGMVVQYMRVLEAARPCLFIFEAEGGPADGLNVRESSLRMPFIDADGNLAQIVSFSDNRRQAEEFGTFFAHYDTGA
ncbi:MAG: hypothetical protein OXR84_05145 [Magnetovibrio sp.]|nr:hypothetical protein [Magnetovibrio sp.]